MPIIKVPDGSMALQPSCCNGSAATKSKANPGSDGHALFQTQNSLQDIAKSRKAVKKSRPAPRIKDLKLANAIFFGTKPSDSEQEPSNTKVTNLDVPKGFLPPALRNCHLHNVVRSIRRCLGNMKEVRDNFAKIVAKDEDLSRGVKKTTLSEDIIKLSRLAETLTTLSREAFVPAHRLNQTAVALYNAEDFLRYPNDMKNFDAIANGRIKLPEQVFNMYTLQKLRSVVDKTVDSYNKLESMGSGSKGDEMHDVLFTFMRAMQDMYAVAMGCQEVFKVLLYVSMEEKKQLQSYLVSLQSHERTEMLHEVQELRRSIDEMVILMEKLSWGSFVVYRLASGKTVCTNEDVNGTNSSNKQVPEKTAASPETAEANLKTSLDLALNEEVSEKKETQEKDKVLVTSNESNTDQVINLYQSNPTEIYESQGVVKAKKVKKRKSRVKQSLDVSQDPLVM